MKTLVKTRHLIAAATAAAIVLAAAPAGAHVSVNPNQAAQGGFAKFAFRVPNEKDSASTTKVEVAFPADHAIANVGVRPHPGWTYAVAKTVLPTPIKGDDGDVTEVVSKVTWTADNAAAAIKPGEFDEFEVSLGPLPKDTGKLVFKALQTYSDGEVVRWIEEPAAGAAEPDHPAPTVTLAKAASTGGDTTATTTAASAQDDSDGDGNGLAVAALIVGGLALLLALAAVLRKPKAPTTA
ncbi:MAG TPA: YcnI family protein [Acidimicrobiales bacterium]|nr:YcnI family protein [Acidimicrobiales bacterium]